MVVNPPKAKILPKRGRGRILTPHGGMPKTGKGVEF